MSSPYPTPWTVGWHHSNADDVDAEGNPATTYSPDLNEDGLAVKVIGWGPAGSRGMSTESDMTRVLWEIDLYVPPGVSSAAADVVDLPLDGSIGQFEVVGMPEDFNHGPFGFTPGSVVRLKRVSG